eukprot:UN29432
MHWLYTIEVVSAAVSVLIFIVDLAYFSKWNPTSSQEKYLHPQLYITSVLCSFLRYVICIVNIMFSVVLIVLLDPEDYEPRTWVRCRTVWVHGFIVAYFGLACTVLFLFGKQLNLQIILWEIKEPEALGKLVLKWFAGMAFFLLTFTIMYAWRLVIFTSQFEGSEACLKENISSKLQGKLVGVYFTFVELGILYKYVVMVRRIVKKKNESLMDHATERVEQITEIQYLTRQHIIAALIIITTSWARFLTWPLGAEPRLIFGRIDGWFNYFGMLYSMYADKQREAKKATKWQPKL